MTTPIIDNRARKVADLLRGAIRPGDGLSVVSAYFTIYGYEALRDELDRIERMRFLYGDPRGVGDVDPGEAVAKAFRLTDEGGLEPSRALRQKPLARACAKWIEERVDVRTLRQANLLHGKMYHVDGADGAATALAGSSNFTRRGLGEGASPNIEINLEVGRESDRTALLAWFDDLWNDERLTSDAKQEVLDALARLGRDFAPEFVYYKTLYHVLQDRLVKHLEGEKLVGGVDLHDSAIWKKLYEFQRDGAVTAINRILRHNGCIIADSVGLGKTYTALAVIKYFEARNANVLVLCPSRLKQNWLLYPVRTAQIGNEFIPDRFGYTVLAHTDLSRTKGMAGDTNLATFNWSAFDLIVIDESHNFRNEGRDRKDEDGNLIARSRYRRLLEEVLKEGVATKVLMLSATPVNTSLRDLRNQIYLMTEKREDAFREELGVGSVQSVFRTAQKAFQRWEDAVAQGGRRDKAELLEKLGADFLSVLDAVTIARSRRHIRDHYPDAVKRIGGFPERSALVNLSPATDVKGELSYDDLHDRISRFRMAVYMPSAYVTDTTDLEAEKRKLNFDQRDRERWLIGMIRVNLLKRLESSVDSFVLTMERIVAKMDELVERIVRWREKGDTTQFPLLVDDDEEDEDFALGKKGKAIPLISLDDERLLRDLRRDRETFRKILDRARRVTPERDAKLIGLREALTDKVRGPTTDKAGRRNRKALVFTTFSDTARYLYHHLEPWAREEGVSIALVAGSAGTKTSCGPNNFADIVARFAPRAQGRIGTDDDETAIDDPIDILIATDCLSEGQNLQDCDLVINYDIHWNPVRLMQRLGRIDRIGSASREVRMVNFWPTANLDRYLDLKNRVEARMVLADAAATGKDDPLGLDRVGADDAKKAAAQEIAFRDEQLKRIREESLDLEDMDDGVSLSDFTLDDFLADLLNYLKRNEKELREAPSGISAVVPPWPDGEFSAAASKEARPGAIFCLRQKKAPEHPTPNRLRPYFLAYVREDGTVRYTYQHAKQVLALFGALARGRTKPLQDLVDAFDSETDFGAKMGRYDKLIGAAIRKTLSQYRRELFKALGKAGKGKKVPKRSQQLRTTADFELVTWLVIRGVASDA